MSTRKMPRIPGDEDLDVHGLTHTGRIREENQDQFLIASLQRRMRVMQTSIPDTGRLPRTAQTMTCLLLVADGVGGKAGGQEASGTALESLVDYVTHHVEWYYSGDPSDDEAAFELALEEAVMSCHQAVVSRETSHPEWHGMATTLTIVTVVWPTAYVVQVGDSRCYHMRDATLRRVTRDQTVAQDLIDEGAMTEDEAEGSRWSNVLSSSIGGKPPHPELSKFELHWDDTLMLCSDGLTKHASDTEIEMCLRDAASAEGACTSLLDIALGRGGTDNITIVTLRLR